jgi:uncharacterized phage infection (PIP) family protein YhgE
MKDQLSEAIDRLDLSLSNLISQTVALSEIAKAATEELSFLEEHLTIDKYQAQLTAASEALEESDQQLEALSTNAQKHYDERTMQREVCENFCNKMEDVLNEALAPLAEQIEQGHEKTIQALKKYKEQSQEHLEEVEVGIRSLEDESTQTQTATEQCQQEVENQGKQLESEHQEYSETVKSFEELGMKSVEVLGENSDTVLEKTDNVFNETEEVITHQTEAANQIITQIWGADIPSEVLAIGEAFNDVVQSISDGSESAQSLLDGEVKDVLDNISQVLDIVEPVIEILKKVEDILA